MNDGGVKKLGFFTPPFSGGNSKKRFRTDKLSQAKLGLPEAVCVYRERRSLFVAKRHTNKKNRTK